MVKFKIKVRDKESGDQLLNVTEIDFNAKTVCVKKRGKEWGIHFDDLSEIIVIAR